MEIPFMSETNQMLLFGANSPGVLRLVDMYDPLIHGSSPAESGKTVPVVDSLIVDDTNALADDTNTVAIPIYVVKSVHPITRKAVLVPGRFIDDTTLASDRIIGYGNDIYMLFYDARTTPTRLVIDSKLILFGNNSAEYRLLKTDSTGVSTCISLNISSSNVILGERVPIEETGVAAVRRCGNCYTSTILNAGDPVTLELYDAAGILTARISLIAEPATILNDLAAGANPIVDFTATANQQSGTGSTDPWFLYADQDTTNLTLYPRLHFSNGAIHNLTVDNRSCFIYGLGDINTQLIGREYPILVKYFLADRVQSTIAQGDAIRFLTYQNVVQIRSRTQYGYSKISVVPMWNQSAGSWELRFFAYYQSRTGFVDITNAVTYSGTAFSGSTLNRQQVVVLSTQQTLPDGSTTTYLQSLAITLDTYNSTIPYLIASSAESVLIYGQEDEAHDRPRIRYDAALSKYFIPTSAFISVDKFIEHFYIDADAPWLTATETVPPTPTHFIIRSVSSGGVLVANPIPVAQYAAQMTWQTVGGANQYLDSTVIVEFLLQVQGQYLPLYGVPVTVYAGTYNV